MASSVWDNIQSIAWIAFYDQPNCTGNSSKYWAGVRPKSYTGPVYGTFDAKKAGMETSVRSLMVMESGMYPTRGIQDVSPVERAPVLVKGSFVETNIISGIRTTVDSDRSR